VDYRAAARTAKALVEEFLAGKYASVKILYTAFESMVKFVPTVVDLLPVEAKSEEGEDARAGDVILEPDAKTIFERLIPRYLETRVYNALIEALTSEYASRRVAMKNATDAAGEMQVALKSLYNRKRQEGITKDLLDIVGGAEALR
jgi:F-type H+-transporting ATPase subunit gamma